MNKCPCMAESVSSTTCYWKKWDRETWLCCSPSPFTSSPSSTLFSIPLLFSSQGLASFIRLLSFRAKNSHWSRRNHEMSCISSAVKQILDLGCEKRGVLVDWQRTACAIFAPPNSTQRVAPARKGKWMEGAHPYSAAFWPPKYFCPPRYFFCQFFFNRRNIYGCQNIACAGNLSPLDFLSAGFFWWQMYPHLPLFLCKILWQTKNLNKIKTMKNQHVALASCDPSRVMQSKNPGGQDPEAEPRMRQKKNHRTQQPPRKFQQQPPVSKSLPATTSHLQIQSSSPQATSKKLQSGF